jgi:hypothetical protein
MLAALLAFLRKLFAPVNVVTVNATLLTDVANDDRGLRSVVLEITNQRTGETLAIETVHGDEDRMLLRQIAVTVKSLALRRGRLDLPPWQVWTPEALAAQLRGIDHEDEASTPLTTASQP